MDANRENSNESSEETVWLSSGQAAKHLGITPRTLYRLINEGQLVGFRFGRVIRLKQCDVDRFIDDDDGSAGVSALVKQ
jgi:excisionase family DNA binding protein